MRPIEDIAREAGMEPDSYAGGPVRFYDADDHAASLASLERFAAIVRAEALEEAASLTKALRPYGRGDCDDLAGAIRRLKDTK